MDPDEALERILDLAASWRTGATRDGEAPDNLSELAELVSNLDEWIAKGGFLPSRWDVPRHIPKESGR